MNDITN